GNVQPIECKPAVLLRAGELIALVLNEDRDRRNAAARICYIDSKQLGRGNVVATLRDGIARKELEDLAIPHTVQYGLTVNRDRRSIFILHVWEFNTFFVGRPGIEMRNPMECDPKRNRPILPHIRKWYHRLGGIAFG